MPAGRSQQGTGNPKVPRPTIKRLGLYYRCLSKLRDEGKNFVSSKTIAERLSLKPSQVRKDLSYFGEFGKRGFGYDVQKLIDEIARIIGVNKEWRVAIVGAGNLGSALANYPGLPKHKFKIVALFDVDGGKVGKTVAGVPVYHVDDIARLKRELDIELAVIAVPESAAQDVAELIREAGFLGIVNFAPTRLRVDLPVEDVDITLSFDTLAYNVVKSKVNTLEFTEE